MEDRKLENGKAVQRLLPSFIPWNQVSVKADVSVQDQLLQHPAGIIMPVHLCVRGVGGGSSLP